ncbi:MAG: hypothetical protein A2365_03665 [Candidatus Nealsonbacteria bacterium RIFOXYB1_FULL_40_15]|uniref:Uncharacterized protein n=1 Tax=Candidatus Nealsonbacteria bacterium RIFOXYB1_FULL_40_15 TaxID=1801677 RepID=A0A1G2EPH6_9BACT|nr:MAG: hypothetical protein A2365_03665 [Candidatus Nealsonbacteria bacterium RIFOXYB1_FULL_40_15]OGZ29524.1 MAG: hypothetical protein A2562_02435 [Candidatus Nealsonbacteria bacterium RIFOXYD1_FULL_39_11]
MQELSGDYRSQRPRRESLIGTLESPSPGFHQGDKCDHAQSKETDFHHHDSIPSKVVTQKLIQSATACGTIVCSFINQAFPHLVKFVPPPKNFHSQMLMPEAPMGNPNNQSDQERQKNYGIF